MQFWRRTRCLEIFEIQATGLSGEEFFLAKGVAVGPGRVALAWVRRQLASWEGCCVRGRAIASQDEASLRRLVRNLFPREGNATAVAGSEWHPLLRHSEITKAILDARGTRDGAERCFYCLSGLPLIVVPPSTRRNDTPNDRPIRAQSSTEGNPHHFEETIAA